MARSEELDLDHFDPNDKTALHFTPRQKAEREHFVSLLRIDLGCGEVESVRQGIARLKAEVTELREKLSRYETLCHRNEDCPVTELVNMVRTLRHQLYNYHQNKSMYGVMDDIVAADKLLEKYK